jgi:hypothetical protein
MALFNLTDIKFKTDRRQGTEALVSNSKYRRDLLRYPSDLGATDKGHYIVININEQINTTQSTGELVAGDLPTIIGGRTGDDTTAGNLAAVIPNIGQVARKFADSINNKVDDNVFVNTFNAIERGFNLAKDGLTNLGFKEIDPKIGVRTIRRISDTIALYMPDTLNFSYGQGYEQLEPGKELTGAVLAGLSSASGTIRGGGDAAEILKSVAPFVANYALREFGATGKILFAAGTGGKVNNPMLEIAYSSPEFRSFRFDFMLYPRDEKEALEVQNIINKLRFHQAPEIVKNTGGFFLYPPSEFDISFYYNGSENPNIPKISTCVLTTIDTDYAPNGFSAYEVPGEMKAQLGRTGMPVAIRLSLNFKETEYLVKGSPLLGEIGRQRERPDPTINTTTAGGYAPGGGQ